MLKNIILVLLSTITVLTLAASALAAPSVLFDEVHAQQFLIGKDGPLDADEVEAVLNFIRNGGGLAVMLHILPPALKLLRQLHVGVANGTRQKRCPPQGERHFCILIAAG